MNDILIATIVGVVLIILGLVANDWRQGAAARRRGWFMDAGYGPVARAAWRWQDRRMRRRS